MSLRDLRRTRKQTQVRVAEKLRINQENVSRLEQRSDLALSTLRGYVAAMGGKLSLVVEFPDRPPVALTGLAALDDRAHLGLDRAALTAGQTRTDCCPRSGAAPASGPGSGRSRR